jgi:hypothetical protein
MGSYDEAKDVFFRLDEVRRSFHGHRDVNDKERKDKEKEGGGGRIKVAGRQQQSFGKRSALLMLLLLDDGKDDECWFEAQTVMASLKSEKESSMW